MKKVSVVIVNYHGKGVIEQCLRSVFSSEEVFFDVILVDNNSRDGSLERVKEFFPKVRCLAQQENGGFAKGANTGIQFALEHGADFVFLLNNDAVVEKDCLALLVRYSEENEKGVFSPVVLSTKNPRKVWFCGGKINWLRMRAVHTECPTGKEPIAVEYLSGCALFIPKRAFFDVGLLDTDYFLYYEDTDWSVRARRSGYDLWVIPQAEAVHQEQSEQRNPLKVYFLVLSGILFFQKNAVGWQRGWCHLFLFLRMAKNTIDRRFHLGDPLVTDNVFHAYADFRNGTPLRHYRALRKG